MWMYHVWDIPREFLGHNFVFGLCTLKPKNLKNTFKNLKNLKKLKTYFFLKTKVFTSPARYAATYN